MTGVTTLRAIVLGSLLVASSAVAGSITPAEAATTCPATERTATTGGFNLDPSIDAAGTRIAFESDRNIGGGNPDGGFEIYVHDTAGPTTTQITDTGANNTHSAAISADGSRIAFASNANIGGGNPDGNLEIYLHQLSGSVTTQITDTTGSANSANQDPTISADGTRIAFASSRNLGGTNPDLNREIFLHDTSGPTTTQVTTTTGGSNVDPTINAAGTRIAFSSDRDIGAGNGDLNAEIFLHDTAGPTTTRITTTTGGANVLPSINGAGTRVAFQSDRDIGGGNPDANDEIYVHDTAGPTTTQITTTTGGSSFQPSISASGTHIVFESDRDIGGGNPDGNFEVYRHGPTGIIQVTDTPSGFNAITAINADGSRIAFESDSNVGGLNPDLSAEIALAVCASPTFCDGQPVTVQVGLFGSPTSGADVIRGTPGADTVNALGGNDRFCGLGGGDTFTGGPGSDRAFGGNGDDTLLGQDGNDLANGGNGVDSLLGQAGNDVLEGGAANDTLMGQAGSDTCRGQTGGGDVAVGCEFRTGVP